ncbi:hypothetical protein ID866_12261, partial [Astraeus odoratus]
YIYPCSSTSRYIKPGDPNPNTHYCTQQRGNNLNAHSTRKNLCE